MTYFSKLNNYNTYYKYELPSELIYIARFENVYFILVDV